ncbi:MAG: DUF4013 domain-containing protein [Methanobacterium sp.]|nr:DUF4013 domain-containing protein [Methanobacterium sp.]
MDAGQISSNALKYPLNDFKKVLILGILSIFSVLIIPGFLLLGYVFRIIKSSMEDSNEPPQFDEWTSMFVDGLKVFVVFFIYYLIPGILILLGTWAAFLPMLTQQGAGSLVDPSINVGLISGIAVIGIGLLIVVSFIIPLALANMVYYDQISAAFRFGELFDKLKEIGGVDYFIWYVVMLVIAVAASYICFFLVFPLFIGIIIVPLIIYPYLTMFYSRSTALVYAYGKPDPEYYRHKKQIK